MNSKRRVVVIAIGEIGVGKSEFGNGFLQKRAAFPSEKNPESITFGTIVKSHEINGIRRYYIDTQGIDIYGNYEKEYNQELLSFLKDWKYGINALFIMINPHNPRFNIEMQEKIKLLNDFYESADLWHHTGIIFSKCYPYSFNREKLDTQYRVHVINYIKTLPGCENINLQMPTFFLDSVNWDDDNTKFEYNRVLEFALKKTPLLPQKTKETNQTNMRNTRKFLEIFDEDINTEKKSSNPELIASCTDEEMSQIIEEKKFEKIVTKKEIFKILKDKHQTSGKISPKHKYKVHDYYLVTTKYIEYTRENMHNENGEILTGEWVQTNSKTETTKE